MLVLQNCFHNNVNIENTSIDISPHITKNELRAIIILVRGPPDYRAQLKDQTYWIINDHINLHCC